MKQILLFIACLAFVHGKNVADDTPAAAAAAEAADAGLAWLLQRQEADHGWGVDTAVAVTAASLVNGSALAGTDRELTLKQLQVNLLADLWRHRDYPLTAGRLADYVMALASLCADVRNFQGKDVTAVLQHHRGTMDYESAMVVLATCVAGAPVRRRSYGRLLEVTDGRGELHGTDTLALAVLALRCVADNTNKHVEKHLQPPLVALVGRQKEDGGFGNFHATLLAVQALRAERAVDWDEAAAMAYLTSHRRSDDSFGSVFDTARVLPVLAGRSLLDIDDTACRRDGRTEPSATATETAMSVTSTEQPLKSSLSPSPHLANVTLWLWIGVDPNQTYSCQLTVPENTSLFDCMKLAAERDKHFEFSAEVWPNGHYIHTIDGHRERKDGFHFWLLYSLDAAPDTANRPTSADLHSTGVDNLYPEHGSHVLFWYKDL